MALTIRGHVGTWAFGARVASQTMDPQQIEGTDRPLHLGVYVVTAAGLVEGRTHLDVANAALAGGADAVQLRAPELSRDALRAVARDIAAATRATGTLGIINDDLEVAMDVGAAGVHLGQGDLAMRGYAVPAIRRRLGAQRVLGITTETVAQARAAESAGADYLGVTVFETGTKGDAEAIGVDGLREVVDAVAIPVVAIGGIHAGNAEEVLAAGARGVAVVSAVAAAEDPVAATRQLRELVDGFEVG